MHWIWDPTCPATLTGLNARKVEPNSSHAPPPSTLSHFLHKLRVRRAPKKAKVSTYPSSHLTPPSTAAAAGTAVRRHMMNDFVASTRQLLRSFSCSHSCLNLKLPNQTSLTQTKQATEAQHTHTHTHTHNCTVTALTLTQHDPWHRRPHCLLNPFIIIPRHDDDDDDDDDDDPFGTVPK